MTDKEKATAALMTIEFWNEASREAARVHPNWTVAKGGELEWLGGRTGPRTPRTLFNWFREHYPDKCERIAERIEAKWLFTHTSNGNTTRLH
jgi:hypothetical protein